MPADQMGGRKELVVNATIRMLTRRRLAIGVGSMGLLASVSPSLLGAARAQQGPTESLVIDLDGEVESIHPSLAYSGRDWSVVNSIYDSIVTIDSAGAVVPLAAEAFESDDAATFRVRLREGLLFHDGSPVTAETIRLSLEFLMTSGSSVSDVFSVIDEVTVEGELDARIVCAAAAPWLPAQIATWMMLVPEGYTEEQALTKPVGTGPYEFESGDPGQELQLRRFDGYQLGDVKGDALADSVTFRIVPDAATRVADIATGTAHIAVNVPDDFREEIESQGAEVVDDPLVGSWWIRIGTDVEPFGDPRVRRALNYAVDTVTIGEALLGPETRPLGSIFPDERAPGFLEELEPYPYDPDRARELLLDAGVEEGMSLELEVTQSARRDVAEAIAGYLSDVGFDVEVIVSDIATFNAGWSDPERPVLRMATWSPLFEPHTLLSLVFADDGYLSRYDNGEVGALILEASGEPDQERRRDLYEEVNRLMHEDPPVIFLWNLTATYAVAANVTAWTPDGNDQVIPTGDPA
jgi:peptide/nickel transport system substrate-binding protein